MEKEKIIDNLENETTDEQSDNESQNKIDDVVDDAKEIAGKAIDFVGDAAKVAVGFAGGQLNNAKSIFKKVGKGIADGIEKKNFEKYGPIFISSLEEKGITYPKMINVFDYDKQMDVADCKDAVGYFRTIKDVNLLGINHKNVKAFEGIEFYPDKYPSSSVYYVHPLNDKQYIEITEYFKYLKEQRVSELEYIAQELGAKYFKVEIFEETLASESSKTKAEGKFGVKKDKAGFKVEVEDNQKTYEYIGIAAENTYSGKEPKEPQLKLWANNESIKSLVKQRLATSGRLQSKTFRLDYNTSTGIKEKEAAKIDGVLKFLKFSSEGIIQKEVQKETKRRLVYTIEF